MTCNSITEKWMDSDIQLFLCQGHTKHKTVKNSTRDKVYYSEKLKLQEHSMPAKCWDLGRCFHIKQFLFKCHERKWRLLMTEATSLSYDFVTVTLSSTWELMKQPLKTWNKRNDLTKYRICQLHISWYESITKKRSPT